MKWTDQLHNGPIDAILPPAGIFGVPEKRWRRGWVTLPLAKPGVSGSHRPVCRIGLSLDGWPGLEVSANRAAGTRSLVHRPSRIGFLGLPSGLGPAVLPVQPNTAKRNRRNVKSSSVSNPAIVRVPLRRVGPNRSRKVAKTPSTNSRLPNAAPSAKYRTRHRMYSTGDTTPLARITFRTAPAISRGATVGRVHRCLPSLPPARTWHFPQPFRHLHQRMEVIRHHPERQHLHPAFQTGALSAFRVVLRSGCGAEEDEDEEGKELAAFTVVRRHPVKYSMFDPIASPQRLKADGRIAWQPIVRLPTSFHRQSRKFLLGPRRRPSRRRQGGHGHC